MKCPKCDKELSYVYVIQKDCVDMGLDEDGNLGDDIIHEWPIDTEGIECPECGADLSDRIEYR